MRIALCRTGTVTYSDFKSASPVAGNQDVLGVMRYLIDAGHDVCLFGRSKGEFPCHTVNVELPKGEATWHEMRPFVDDAVNELGAWKPEVCVNLVGACPTLAVEENPWGVYCHQWAMRTVAPCLVACQELELKRICIVNDPRNYTKDHEMLFWPHTKPVAFLSQETRTFKRTIRGHKTNVVGVDAHAENWWSYGMPVTPPDTEREFETVVIAHAHFNNGLVLKGRDHVWQQVIEAYEGEHLTIIGKGWEGWEQWQGVVKHDQVQPILHNTVQGPMIPLLNGFNSGKLREYAIAGCQPRPVVSDTHTYDATAKYVPMHHESRVFAGKPWSVYYDASHIRELQEKTTPNFGALERCLEALDDLPKLELFGGIDWL